MVGHRICLPKSATLDVSALREETPGWARSSRQSTGKTEGGDRRCNVWSAIVQKADSSSLFDDPDSASHGGVIGFDKLSKTKGCRLLGSWQVREASARALETIFP